MRQAVRAIRSLYDAALFQVALVLMYPFRRYLTEVNVQLGGLYFYVSKFLLGWVIVWAIQWWLFPDWLVNTKAGLGTMLQVVPATIVAIFVLVLGSIFVVAQQTIGAYGTRAALMLVGDHMMQGLVVRPLLIAVAAVLLAGQIPDSGAPGDALTAAAGTTALATVSIIGTSASILPGLFLRYTAPVSFARLVNQDVEDYLRNGWTGLVVFRVGVLAEMLKSSIRRGDSVSAQAAIQGLGEFHDAYLAASADNPDARVHTYDDGHTEEGWLAEPLRGAFVRAGEDAMVSNAPESDSDQIGLALRYAAEKATGAGHTEEAEALIEGLMNLGTSIHQLAPSGAANIFAKAAEGLVHVEATAEESGEHELAVKALAGWILVTNYPKVQFNSPQHPLWEPGIDDLGPNPPFDEAGQLILSEPFMRRWINKMPAGAMPLIADLAETQKAHAERES